MSCLRKQRCLCLFLPLLLCIIAALSYLTYSNQDKLIDYNQTISSRVINSTHKDQELQLQVIERERERL